MLEWLSFIIGLAGVGLALLALKADRLGIWQGRLFDAGAVVLVISGFLIFWPLMKRAAVALKRRRAPLPLGMLYEVAVKSGALGGPTETRERFIPLITSLAQRGSLQLLGRYHDAGYAPVPPAHLSHYALLMMPDLAGRGYVFRTIRPEDFPTNLNDPEAYLRLHVARRGRDVFLAALATAMQPRDAVSADT